MPLPPRIVRRLLIDPLAVAFCLAMMAVSPVLLLAAAIADLVLPGRWRTLRVTAFVVAYLVLQVVGLVWMFVLWVASGFGATLHGEWMQDRHYGFMRWWLASMHALVKPLFGLRISIEDPPKPRAGPILVFCRHGGPGNSLMLVGTLMIAYRRRPRIVMLSKLQWEPLFDVMGNRLPNRFIEHDPKQRDLYVRTIAELATGLGERDAFVPFPEGHDFTPQIRLRAIAHLRRGGHLREALKAERMKRVLPPKLGGTEAAISAAPDADVVFVAHTVLEDIPSIGHVWSNVPLAHAVTARYWRLPPSDVPGTSEERRDWLFEWWARIDEWIDLRRARDEGALSEAVPKT